MDGVASGAERQVPFVIIENNAEAIERAEQGGYLIIPGDATQDPILEKAGIRHARALMAASDSDAGNTYITLTAKAMRYVGCTRHAVSLRCV